MSSAGNIQNPLFGDSFEQTSGAGRRGRARAFAAGSAPIWAIAQEHRAADHAKCNRATGSRHAALNAQKVGTSGYSPSWNVLEVDR